MAVFCKFSMTLGLFGNFSMTLSVFGKLSIIRTVFGKFFLTEPNFGQTIGQIRHSFLSISATESLAEKSLFFRKSDWFDHIMHL